MLYSFDRLLVVRKKKQWQKIYFLEQKLQKTTTKEDDTAPTIQRRDMQLQYRYNFIDDKLQQENR